MKLGALLSILSIWSTAAAVNQPFANDSPAGVEYAAFFEDKLYGHVGFKGLRNGSIEVQVALTNFPKEGGPYPYHVHAAPVPADGNCTGTLAHLNPFGGNINATNPNELEVGNLAGRYGALKGDTPYLTYIDQYLSLDPLNPAYVGGLSVVVHFANDTRYDCANITQISFGQRPSKKLI